MADQETNVTTTDTNEQNQPEVNSNDVSNATTDNAEIARLKADLAKQKAALDKATKEAAENKRLLRARQTEEEAAAEAEKERQEAIEKELNELRKERAVALVSKSVYTFVQDEKIATTIAEGLYGAEDADGVVAAFNKAWAAKEKALKLEYGKVPAPGAGSPDGTPMTKAEIMKIKDPSERQKAISEHINLFT